MPHKIELYLIDISNSIDSIFEYLGEARNFNAYEANKLLPCFSYDFEVANNRIDCLVVPFEFLEIKTKYIFLDPLHRDSNIF